MTSYIITEQDKEELQQYRGCNELYPEFWIVCQSQLRKSKWTVQDLRSINDSLEYGIGHLLYQLFEVKAKHPLFMKYYGSDPRIEPQLSMEELHAMADKMKRGGYNVRLHSVDIVPGETNKGKIRK